MAPRRFPQFRKLPPELRLRIWALMMQPRIIHAKWATVLVKKAKGEEGEKWLPLYFLTAGPVPQLLRINQETRHEAKKHYSLIRSRLPYKPQDKPGGKLPPGKTVRVPKWTQDKIWVNSTIDTLYAVNFPSTSEFTDWFRSLSSPKIGGLALARPIKNIALIVTVAQRLRNSGRTNVFYHLCMEHPELESITIVFDNSNFESDGRPHTYSFRPLAPKEQGDNRQGGTNGNNVVRKEIENIFERFWLGKPNIKDCDKWMTWRERHPNWREPEVHMVKISKNPKGKPRKNADKSRISKPLLKKTVA